MLRAAGVGLVASGVVAAGLALQSAGRPLPVYALLGVIVIAALLQKIVIERRPVGRIYEGLTDLFIHIHTASLSDFGWKWAVRGVISLLLAIAGGLAGVEGAAMELSYAFAVQLRSRSERWFEQRRRTDSASSLAAGISAAFGAPFAGFIAPIEMGIGGKMLPSAVSSVFAFLGISLLRNSFGLKAFDLGASLFGFSLWNPKEWLGILLIGVTAALIGFVLVRFLRYCQRGFQDLARGRGWLKMILGGIALFAIAILYKGGYLPPNVLLDEVLWSRRAPGESALAFFTKALSLAFVLSSFGTLGLFWPIFCLGGLLGFTVHSAGFHGIPAFGAASGMIGASALWAAVLGTPLAAAVLVFEMTQNVQLLLPCLIAGGIARELTRLAPPHWSRGFIDESLEGRGLRLVGGRSLSVLDSIQVRDAMVMDHESVGEHEAVSELRATLVRSRYPYLTVVNQEGIYQGMLTVDMVRDAWYTDRTVTSSHSSLSKLLEVKDLLYRSGFSTPTVKEDQKLSEVNDLMDRFPCLAVLNGDGKVSGLLLVQNARQAYDREVTRRSLDLALLNVDE